MEINIGNLIYSFSLTPEEAYKYFESLGVRLSDNWEETWRAIQEDSFAISGVKNMDLLLQTKDLILQAIESGKNFKQFKEEIIDTLGLVGWHADLVVSQNISNAYSAGSYQRALETSAVFPYMRPIVTSDSKTTDICKWLNGNKFAIRIDDPDLNKFINPRHFRCRTIWKAINEKQRIDLGLPLKKGKDIPEKYWNSKEFRRLPNVPIQNSIDLSKYPKDLIDQFNKI